MTTGAARAGGVPEYYLLDMGEVKYGDCILCRFPGDTNVLIDAGNVSDGSLVKGQLEKILGASLRISLLVLTHWHGDHLGCLPELLADLEVEWALMPDPTVRYGTKPREMLSPEEQERAETATRVFVALTEEGAGAHPGEATRDFVARSVNVAGQYEQVIGSLEEKLGDRLVVFRGTRGTKNLKALEQQFAGIGLKVLGPSKEQIAICEERLGQVKREVEEAVRGVRGFEDPNLVETLYRQFTEAAGTRELTRGSSEPRGCVNDTSIVLAMGTGPAKALFLGDMQLADPMVGDVVPLVEKLCGTITANGPYGFIKLAHHTSENGLSEEILTSWLSAGQGGKLLVGHSGGRDADDDHPDSAARGYLEAHQEELLFARTDHNGQVKVTMEGGTLVFAKPKAADLNDFSDPG